MNGYADYYGVDVKILSYVLCIQILFTNQLAEHTPAIRIPYIPVGHSFELPISPDFVEKNRIIGRNLVLNAENLLYDRQKSTQSLLTHSV